MSNDMGMDQDELKAILDEFFTEADENLDNFEQDLIQLEALAEEGGGALDKETVDRLFRGLHTLKGGAGFLGLERMAKLAHAGENLLDEVRNAKVPVTKPVMDALLQSSDALKVLLNIYKARGDDTSVDNTVLVAELERLVVDGGAAADGAGVVPVAAPAAAASGPAINHDLLAEVLADPTMDPSRDNGGDEPVAKPAKPAAAAPAMDASLVNADLLAEVMADSKMDPSLDKGEEGAPVAAKPVSAPVPVAAKAAPTAAEAASAEKVAQIKRANNDEGGDTIRVETSRLDKVMNLVGELVLARNSLVRQLNENHVRAALDGMDNQPLIYANIEQLSRVTQDLQMSVLSTRMQPIKKVFDKIPRQVRELKTKLKKEVNLIIEGENTEVDKSLVEDLADPMVHMVRNALDHGIETPDEREMAGKPREGTMVVRAFYEGNNVVIQVQEDGKGIDPAIIRKVAVKKGIISESAAAALSDGEAIRLIMAAGFSTAEKITDVSGRGVGMDVVNTKIANLQGTLDIRSEKGQGTCFSIYLPLTLAIVNALVVGSNKEGFAIPIGDISEVIKFNPEDIHHVSTQDVIELRGEPLPLYYLGRLTKSGLIPSFDNATVEMPNPSAELSLDDLENAVSAHTVAAVAKPNKHASRGFVVVVRDGTSSMGLVVDELLGQEEVVVKPVSDVFEYNRAISGATITGDGKVHMILDVPFLLKELSGLR
ncbi:MAG: chemotaxis protein CheA [Alphaproteobacteria bacterium]